jgi:putative ATPase
LVILGVAYNQAVVYTPLASRMRPKEITEVLGQGRLIKPGSPLHRLITGDKQGSWCSILLWGSPGSGKTTIARLISNSKDAHFVELSAISASVAAVREVIDAAKKLREIYERPTILFLDEIHRFSKSQQDSLLGAVESGVITLIAATTENPSFSVIKPLISRSLVFHLEPLSKEDLLALMERARISPDGLKGLAFEQEALDYIARISAGDARRALTLMEAAANQAAEPVTLEVAMESSENAIAYDPDGDVHYDTISAFIKSVRGSDADAAIHYLARMIVGGEDPKFIARRLMILAAEDIGLADPNAIVIANAVAQTVERIGMPEGRIPLAEATIYLALAPKSNRAYEAINAAIADVESGNLPQVPAPLRSTGAVGYKYPHDSPVGILKQTYAELERGYYSPSNHGFERTLQERQKAVQEILGR